MTDLNSVGFFSISASVSDGGYFKPAPKVDWSMREAADPTCKFYYITEGECEITVNGKSYAARAGDWFFIPARVKHSYHNFIGKPFAKYWMHFEIYPVKDIVKLLGIDYCIRVGDEKRIKELFSRFAVLYGSREFADGLEVKSILFELLAIFARHSAKRDSEILTEPPTAINSVISYIENNMSLRIENKVLADIMRMHPTHFIRYFKKETGQTPKDYISRRKMERAKILLETTELQISEISERLGFYDSMHFSKSFKKRYSISPTTYRKIYSK